MRECPFCGRYVAEQLTQCPFCREALPQAVHAGVSGAQRENARRQIRRGLLYMLLASVIHYFAGGFSGFSLPLNVVPIVTQYLLPLLFFGGLGLTLFGAYRWVSA